MSIMEYQNRSFLDKIQYGKGREEKLELIKKFDGISLEDNSTWLIKNHPESCFSYYHLDYLCTYGWFWSRKEKRLVWVCNVDWHWKLDWWGSVDDDWGTLTRKQFEGKQKGFLEWGEEMFLYIIKQIDEEYDDFSTCKIGISKDPNSRLKSLQTSNPNELELVCVWQTISKSEATFLERECHNQFSMYKKKGEWFDMPDYLIESFVSDVKKQYTWEQENPEKASEQMTTGLYRVLLSEKYSQQSIMVEHFGRMMTDIKTNMDEDGIEEFKNVLESESNLTKKQIEKMFTAIQS